MKNVKVKLKTLKTKTKKGFYKKFLNSLTRKNKS